MMVGGGVDEDLGADDPRPVDEWPPPGSNMELANKDGTSSRLLFLTVQYVGEDGNTNFNSGLESFAELEQRVVSPLDPNMGCTACYSPVYRPATPLIPAPVSPSSGYVTPPPPTSLPEPGMIVLSDQYQFSSDNYVVTAGGRMYSQDQVSDDGKLLLLSADNSQPTELVVGGESCSDQRVELLLSNGTIAYGVVESADDNGTRVIQIPREYLIARPDNPVLPVANEPVQSGAVPEAAQEEHVSDDNGTLRALYNTIEEQGLYIEPEELRLETGLDQAQQLVDPSLLDQSALQQISPPVPAHKRFWCEECNVLLEDDCREHQINRKIIDKAVPSRARATLPASYLAINRIPDSDREEYGVFARKSIPKRTQFGPIEGVIVKPEGLPLDGPRLELTIETDTGELRTMDVSNEHMSNWMRFVRMATPERTANLLLSQLGASLFFTTTHAIHAREELLVWYSPAYAARRNLPVDPPPPVWPCSTCGKKLTSTEELAKHLDCHKAASNSVLFGESQMFLFQ